MNPTPKSPAAARAAVLLAVTAALAGCGHHDASDASAQPRQLQATTLKLVSVDARNLELVAGTVVSSNQIRIASRLSGYVRAIPVHEGQVVKAGQLLLQIDPADVQGQAAQARAALAQAQAGAALAQADVRRYDDLYKAEAIPRQQWEQVQMRGQVAQQQVAAARAACDVAQAQLRYAAVTSPIAGVVVQKLVNPGDLAAPGRPLLVVEGQGTLQVQLQVPDRDFGEVRIGAAAPVYDGSRRIEGRIAEAVPVADPLSHTHDVKVDLPPDAGLVSGGFVQVGFACGEAPQLRVPAAALVDRAGMTGAFVVDSAGIAHFRLVRVGAAAGGQVDVQAGLQPGDTVVVDHLDAVENGVRIVGAGRG